MLEPAVRPGPLTAARSASTRPPNSTPIESRDFDSILQEAQAMARGQGNAAVDDTGDPAAPPAAAPPTPPAAHAGVDPVENPTHRHLMTAATNGPLQPSRGGAA